MENKDGTLHPGVYTIVHLQEPRQYPVITIPSQAIIFDKDGLQAAVYDNGVVSLRHSKSRPTTARLSRCAPGCTPGDQLILDPPIGVVDGMHAATVPDQTT